MSARVRVAVLGDFDHDKHSHWATEAALHHAAAHAGLGVEPRWIATPALAPPGAAAELLAGYHAIWGAPGSPYASADGMLNGIAHARRARIPYLGTCGGFQYALIELSRNVLGIADADTAENHPSSGNAVITLVTACPTPNRVPGKPVMAGTFRVRAVAGTRVAELCGGRDLDEVYFCSYETNAAFIPRWQAEAGLRVAAHGDGGEMRAFELANHPFFVATLFQPQLASRAERPHPIVEGYLRAAEAQLAAQSAGRVIT